MFHPSLALSKKIMSQKHCRRTLALVSLCLWATVLGNLNVPAKILRPLITPVTTDTIRKDDWWVRCP